MPAKLFDKIICGLWTLEAFLFSIVIIGRKDPASTEFIFRAPILISIPSAGPEPVIVTAPVTRRFPLNWPPLISKVSPELPIDLKGAKILIGDAPNRPPLRATGASNTAVPETVNAGSTALLNVAASGIEESSATEAVALYSVLPCL